jgi:hypothetical protein
MAFPKGRAFRTRFFSEKEKRAQTNASIPNATFCQQIAVSKGTTC